MKNAYEQVNTDYNHLFTFSQWNYFCYGITMIPHKIPLDDFKQDTTGESLDYKLGSVVLSPAEYGFAETINQIIEHLKSIEEAEGLR